MENSKSGKEQPTVSTSEPTRHHYVPRCYLKQFVKEGKLFYLNVSNLKQGWRVSPKSCAPSSICLTEHYYTLPEEGKGESQQPFTIKEEDPYHVEKVVLQALENKYDTLFDSITSGNELEMATANDFCHFVILLKMRNPYWEEHFFSKNNMQVLDKAAEAVLKEIMDKDLYRSLSPDIKKAIIADYIRMLKNDPEISRKVRLASLHTRHNNPARAEGLLKAMMHCQWSLLTASDNGPGFLTSDNPGFSVGHDLTVENIRLSGPVTFYLPLSYKYCLAVSALIPDLRYNPTSQSKQIAAVIASDDLIAWVNNFVIEKINDVIIGADYRHLNEISQQMQTHYRR